MDNKKYFFAVDLGATSGRTIIGDVRTCASLRWQRPSAPTQHGYRSNHTPLPSHSRCRDE